MVPNRGRPTLSEWEQIKDEFKIKYLEEDLTLRAVIEHFARRGFVATERQFKTKVKSWGYDKKKIRGTTFHSMYAVMVDRKRMGITTKFIVPTHDNHQNRIVTPEMIVKEINRDRTTFDCNNVRRAENILQHAGVQIVHEDGVNDQPAYGHLPTTQWMNQSTSMAHHQLQPSFMLDEGFNVSSSDDMLSPSVDSMTSATPTNFPLAGIPTLFHDEQVSPASIPSATWPSDASDSRDHAVNNASGRPDGGCHFLSSPAEAGHYFGLLMDMSSLFTEPTVTNTFTITSSSQIWNPADQTPQYFDEEKQLTIQWLAPYVRSSHGYSKNEQADDDLSSQDREKAQAALRTMLGKSNRYIYPGCNWMATVLSSNNEIVLLTIFLADCCEVIDHVDPALELTYGSCFHLSHALWSKNQQEREIYRSKFMCSAFFVSMLWGPESPNNLVNQCLRIWLLLEEKEYSEALPKLRESLCISERVLGPRHIVTLNHLTILARGLVETDCANEAVSIYKNVCSRLESCEELLKAFRYRQMMRLANLQKEIGDVEEAEANLRAIIKFRSAHFGFVSGCTWKSIETLVDLLKQQQRLEEARYFLQESTNEHDEAIQRAWLQHYQEPAPWTLNS